MVTILKMIKKIKKYSLPSFYVIVINSCYGGIGEVWLTHRFVGPARVGSNPTYRPDLARWQRIFPLPSRFLYSLFYKF